MNPNRHVSLIRTVLDDLDQGLSVWDRLGGPWVLARATIAVGPGAVVLVGLAAVPELVQTPIAVGAAVALVLLLDLAAQGLWAGSIGRAAGAGPTPGRAAEFVLRALAALLPGVVAVAGTVTAVATGAGVAVTAFCAVAAVAAAPYALGALGRAAFRAVGGGRDREPSFARRAALMGAHLTIAGLVLAVAAAIGPDGPDPRDLSAPADRVALLRVQAAQLLIARAVALPALAWVWCTWAGVAGADGASPLDEAAGDPSP